MKGVKILALIFFVTTLSAHEKHTSAETRLVGEVIDTVCYVSHESRGPAHLECGRDCANKGISLGILEEKTARIYISLPVDHSNPNAKLAGFLARRVEVEGTVFRKGGLTGIFVRSVREVKSHEPRKGAER